MDFSNWTTKELATKLRASASLRLLDVRDPDEFAAGHIRGAVLLPLSRLKVRLPEMDPQREYALICRSGNRSGQAALIMQQAGFQRVHNVTGGMLAWRGPVI